MQQYRSFSYKTELSIIHGTPECVHCSSSVAKKHRNPMHCIATEIDLTLQHATRFQIIRVSKVVIAEWLFDHSSGMVISLVTHYECPALD